MDSNHRRHSQQIYSLPHLATLVTTRKLLNFEQSLFGKSFVLKSECKGIAFSLNLQMFSQVFSFLSLFFCFSPFLSKYTSLLALKHVLISTMQILFKW